MSTGSPAPWQTHIAALEARLNRLESRWDQLQDVPRQLRSLEHKLDKLLPSQASSAPPVPVSHSPARVVPADAGALSNRVDELTSELGAQGRFMERLLDLMEPYMPEEVQSMRMPRECDEDMSAPFAASTDRS